MRILVVGGGFAGKWLSVFLVQKGATVTLADVFDSNSATRVSAGIIKPITGRRIVKTSNADQILPFAFKAYRELEEKVGFRILYDDPVIQIFSSEGNRNDWYARSAEADVENYLGEFLDPANFHTSLKAPFGGVKLNFSGIVEPTGFEKAVVSFLTDKCEFSTDRIDLNSLKPDRGHIEWNGKTFDMMVLCQGPSATSNTLTGWIPFKPVKGEILDFMAPDLMVEQVISSGIYILPMGEGKYRAGSTYQWEPLDTIITTAARNQIGTSVKELINCDFEIIGQRAGIRPAIIDRRPIVGFHPQYRCIGIFNGLGTKGAMQGPYYAHQAAQLFMNGIAPDSDCDLVRFSKFYR